MARFRGRFPRLFAPGSLALAALLGLAAGTQAQGLRAHGGPDRFLLPPATSITLAGSIGGLKVSEVPNGTVIAWARLSGPPAQILDGDTLRPTIVPGHAGSLRLRLKVIDRFGGVDTDEVLVHVFGDDQDAQISGSARKWHKLSFTFTHSTLLSESGASGTPNPFLDLRLYVHFFHPGAGKVYSVPGFFAADGNAAESGATAGNKYRAHFTPDEAGLWYYVASFRTGSEVVLDPDSEAGQPGSFDGANGSFYVEAADPLAPGFLAKGRLEYAGAHHLRFAETGEWFLKNGAGSPENFLGYYEFDGTTDQGGASSALNGPPYFDGLHHYDAHLADHVDLGVPTWKNGKGRRIFGALSYLAARGVNSVYALAYNVDGGDGADVWPWVPSGDKTRFDVSKLEQWERVLDHMSRSGIVWHVLTQETENDHVLDGGAMGPQRMLYYRELVARFAYAPGLVWNLGEENTNSNEERKAFADTLRDLDPYDHPIAIHNQVGDLFTLFNPLLGTHLELCSLQGDPTNTPPRARQLVLDSEAAGRPWVVNFDEQTPANDGVVPDAVDFWHDLIRRESLWPMLLGQGGGCEWYFGYGHPHSDLDCENFRSRENLWALGTRALDFLRQNVPFQEMKAADELASGNGPSVLALRGRSYLVYLPFGGPATLDLEQSSASFAVSWFDARNGGALQSGAVTQVSGPGVVALGAPPGPGDWAALVRRTGNLAPLIDTLEVEPAPFVAGRDFALLVRARDPDGPADPLTVVAQLTSPGGNSPPALSLTYRGGDLYSFFAPAAPSFAAGTWQVLVTVQDAGGLAASASATFVAE